LNKRTNRFILLTHYRHGDNQAYSAAKIFTGDSWLYDHVVMVEHPVISAVIPSRSLPPGIVVQHFPDAILAPALIDLQIYGAEKLLSVYPESDSLKLNDYCRSGGALIATYCFYQYLEAFINV
jgi:N-acetylglucosamine-6-phosphate deacetylase